MLQSLGDKIPQGAVLESTLKFLGHFVITYKVIYFRTNANNILNFNSKLAIA